MKKLFNTSKNSSYIFTLSIISGFPGSAIYAKELYKQNLVSKADIEKIILFSHFANPIFILSIVTSKPMLVLLSHYIVNLLIGFCIKNKKTTNNDSEDIVLLPKEFFNVFISAIKNCIETSLFILGVIIFFFMITAIFNYPILNVILELSQGLVFLNSHIVNNRLQASLSAALLSFGGISVHVQTMGTLSDIGIKYLPYIKARLIHASLSYIITYLLWTIW